MEKGVLYIVATPIGNLGDITLRALATLKSVDIIAAEDTRRTQKLLNHYDIKTRMLSFHEHSSASRLNAIISDLCEGKNIALVSDAGTPLISDPGHALLRECHKTDIHVESLPGACAAIVSLTLSGFNSSPFVFYGFLNSKSAPRKSELSRMASLGMTSVIYESPNRLIKTLDDICEVMGGDTNICVARELTKLNEETVRLNALAAKKYFSGKESLKGEFAVVIEPIKKKQPSDEDLIADLRRLLASGMTKKEAVAETTALNGCTKNRIYKLLISNF